MTAGKTDPMIRALAMACLLTLSCSTGLGQETGSRVSGRVVSDSGELLHGSTILITHEPTNERRPALCDRNGLFMVPGLRPGGPYTLELQHVGFKTRVLRGLYLPFLPEAHFTDAAGADLVEFVLHQDVVSMEDVRVNSTFKVRSRTGIETIIDKGTIAMMPTIGRNLQDLARLVPQAKVDGNGMISLAGQNNKFNAYYIDGVNINDVMGISLNGAYGGQINTPPISIDALEHLFIQQAPYDVQYGNFTGGSINAVTRSGGNAWKASGWYHVRNAEMAGRSPVPQDVPGGSGVQTRPRLSPFLNQTAGLWTSGPLVRNKLFFFLTLERQDEARPQPFNVSEYKGNSTAAQLQQLADTLLRRYRYDPGSYLEARESIKAWRSSVKLDWNASARNRVTFTFRYNEGERILPRATGSNAVVFQNNATGIRSGTRSMALEWHSSFAKGVHNRLLLTHTAQGDERHWQGSPFPAVNIQDGTGTIFLGSSGTTQLNRLRISEFDLLDIVTFERGGHQFEAGIEANGANIHDLNYNPYFGSYQYRNLNDFLQGNFATRYTRYYPAGDPSAETMEEGGARYRTRRFAFFLGDRLTLGRGLSVTAGVRFDLNMLPDDPVADRFFNDTARPVISGSHDLHGALSGAAPMPDLSIAPRVGFQYFLPATGVRLSGGAGVFTGRILNIWASDMYNNTGRSINIVPSNYRLPLVADPYAQPTMESLGMDPANARGDMVLFAHDLKVPRMFRTTLGLEKRFGRGWTAGLELMYSIHLKELRITNVNLSPSAYVSAEPDARAIQSITTFPSTIPVTSAGTNPYGNIYLLHNAAGAKSHAFSSSATLQKEFPGHLAISAAYTLGNSFALFEPYNNAGPVATQWLQSETVNGKNQTTASRSDMALGHRVYVFLTKRFTYFIDRASTSISVFYNGQSGQPYSYVYGGSMINDAGRTVNADLIHIPTRQELRTMTFVPLPAGNVTISADEQRWALEEFIDSDRYLRAHRGEFAARNGARLPFVHTIDLRVQQEFSLGDGKRSPRLAFTFDLFNLANLLNPSWGRLYLIPGDSFALIRFAGFDGTTSLAPRYQFNPIKGAPYGVQSGSVPGSSARWIGQVGVRITY